MSRPGIPGKTARGSDGEDMKTASAGKEGLEQGRHSRFGEVKDLPPDAPKLGQITLRNNCGMRMLLLFHVAATLLPGLVRTRHRARASLIRQFGETTIRQIMKRRPPPGSAKRNFVRSATNGDQRPTIWPTPKARS